jgi:hypothetical protein
MRPALRILVPAFAAWVAACTTPASPWQIEQAREHLAAGEPDQALHDTERALQAAWGDPAEALITLHLEVLRALGRAAEAEAFTEFVARFAAGEDTYDRQTVPDWRTCRMPKPQDRLVRSWADGGPLLQEGEYDIGVLSAVLQIDEAGRVGEIRVLRARHPAAAWLLIDAIGRARISPTFLEKWRQEQDDPFPASLCVWWDYDRSGNRCFRRASEPPGAAPAPACAV